RSPGAIYALVRELADNRVPVATACRLLQVSTSGYYDWLKRPESPRELRNKKLTEMIRQIHADSHGSYGSPRVHAHLRFKLGEEVNRKRVERLMREAGLQGAHRGKLVDQDSGERSVQPCAGERDQLRPAGITGQPLA